MRKKGEAVWVATPHGWSMTIKMSIKLKHQYNKQSTWLSRSRPNYTGRANVINYIMDVDTDCSKIEFSHSDRNNWSSEPIFALRPKYDLLEIYLYGIILDNCNFDRADCVWRNL